MPTHPHKWGLSLACLLILALASTTANARQIPECERVGESTQAVIEATLSSHPSSLPAQARAAQAQRYADAQGDQREPVVIGLELEWVPGASLLPGPTLRASQQLPQHRQLEAATRVAAAERDQAYADRSATQAEISAEARAWLLARERARQLSEALQEERSALLLTRATMEGFVGLQRLDATALYTTDLLLLRLDEREEQLYAEWAQATAMLEALTQSPELARACLSSSDELMSLSEPTLPDDLDNHPGLRAARAAEEVAIAQSEARLRTRRTPFSWVAGAGLYPSMDSGYDVMVMVGLEAAIMSRPANIEALAEADAAGAAVALAEAEALRWQLERTVDLSSSRWAAAVAAHERIERDELPLLELTLTTLIDRLSLGLTTATEVLRAHQQIVEARTRMVEARFEALEAQRLASWLHATTSTEVTR